MFIVQKPMKTETKWHVCPFHKENPGKPYAGCTCSVGVSAREKTFEEMTVEEWEYYCSQFLEQKPKETP